MGIETQNHPLPVLRAPHIHTTKLIIAPSDVENCLYRETRYHQLILGVGCGWGAADGENQGWGHTLMLEIASALSACCREKNSENPDRCKSVPEGVPVNDI